MDALGDFLRVIAHSIGDMIGIAWNAKDRPEEVHTARVALGLYAIVLLFAVFIAILIWKTS